MQQISIMDKCDEEKEDVEDIGETPIQNLMSDHITGICLIDLVMLTATE